MPSVLWCWCGVPVIWIRAKQTMSAELFMYGCNYDIRCNHRPLCKNPRLALNFTYYPNISNVCNSIILNKHTHFLWVEIQCTILGKDRWNPNFGEGGCCLGLTEKVEPRPPSMYNYCPSSDAKHGITCWSEITICRLQGIVTWVGAKYQK